MKRETTIFKNFIMNIVLTISSFVFPLFTFPYISRILSPSGNGKVSFATSVISYFILLSQLGIPTYGIRACAKVRDNKRKLSITVKQIMAINIIMTIVSYILLIIMVILVPKLYVNKELIFILSSSIFLTTIGVEWLYKALEMYSYITYRSLLFKIISIIAMYIIVKDERDYIIYGIITIISSSASYILNFFYLFNLVDLREKTDFLYKEHIKPIVIFFAMTCATTIYLNLDTVMLGFMKSDLEVGYYSTAIKIKNILVGIVTSLGAVLLPRVTNYINKGEFEKFISINTKAIKFVLFISIPLMCFFMVYARPCILLIAGENYRESISAMRIMLPTLVFIGLTNIMGMQILVPKGKESKVLLSVTIGAMVDLLLNFLLIPQYSIRGAAVGTVAAEISVFLVQFNIDKKFFKQLFYNVRIRKFVIGSVLASFISRRIMKYGDNYFSVLLYGSICFGVVYIVSLLLLKEEFLESNLKKMCRIYKIKKQNNNKSKRISFYDHKTK